MRIELDYTQPRLTSVAVGGLWPRVALLLDGVVAGEGQGSNRESDKRRLSARARLCLIAGVPFALHWKYSRLASFPKEKPASVLYYADGLAFRQENRFALCRARRTPHK